MCQGSVQFVHLNCLQRWIQPEGSSAVNTHCPVCKVRYPEKTQAMMVRPPAILLESWSNHRTLKLRHWVSFAQHGTASLGRFVDHNDVCAHPRSTLCWLRAAPGARESFWAVDGHPHEAASRPVAFLLPDILADRKNPAPRQVSNRR